DCGAIDSEGYLTITGRIKDIFKTSKGKYVAPAPIENRLMASEHMAQVCVVGLDLAQPVALAVFTEDARKLPEAEVLKATEELLRQVNQVLPSHEKMDKVLWVQEDWSVENGFLTPTLKIKRNVVESYYKDAVYAQMASDKKVSFLNV
ncbi:MAG TPA: AMP-dependent synthetase, partial [Cryomorphaceae bacterium]|nr:AMP-dependent synthetase [Cryomorphaceae bacterium]